MTSPGIYVPAPIAVLKLRIVASVVVIVSSLLVTLPMPEKEWSDSYDPAKWRAQYEICKTKLFTKYPVEVDSEEWSKCMGEFE